MTKLLLFPNFQSYILSLTAMQSQDTFLKMESIAKQQIESFKFPLISILHSLKMFLNSCVRLISLLSH